VGPFVTGDSKECQAIHAAKNRVLAAREELKARARAILRPAPLPAHVEHFTTLPTDDPTYDTDCVICQELYEENDHAAIQLQKANCSHVFGRACLQKWVNSGMGNAHRCPSCRQDIAGAFSRAVPTAPHTTANGTELPTRLPVLVGGADSTERTRLTLDNMQRQLSELHQARQARQVSLTEHTSQALGNMQQQLSELRQARWEARRALEAVHIGSLVAHRAPMAAPQPT
jgi:hypothetical protein